MIVESKSLKASIESILDAESAQNPSLKNASLIPVPGFETDEFPSNHILLLGILTPIIEKQRNRCYEWRMKGSLVEFVMSCIVFRFVMQNVNEML